MTNQFSQDFVKQWVEQNDSLIAKLAIKHMNESGRRLTFERSPEFIPQATYEVCTVELDHFIRAVLFEALQSLPRPLLPPNWTADHTKVTKDALWSFIQQNLAAHQAFKERAGPDAIVNDYHKANANLSREAAQMLEQLLPPKDSPP